MQPIGKMIRRLIIEKKELIRLYSGLDKFKQATIRSKQIQTYFQFMLDFILQFCSQWQLLVSDCLSFFENFLNCHRVTPIESISFFKFYQNLNNEFNDTATQFNDHSFNDTSKNWQKSILQIKNTTETCKFFAFNFSK